MDKNKQTSVGWLLDRIEDVDLTSEMWEKIKQQAKEMHKQEIVNAHQKGNEYNGWALRHEHEKYYNETFGGANE